MASAKLIGIDVPVEPEVIELRLTRKEAQLVKSVLGNIGNLTKTGQSIYNTLRNFAITEKNLNPFTSGVSGTPYFKKDLEEIL